MKIAVGNLFVDNISKQEVEQKLIEYVASNTAHYFVTPYSEFIVEAAKNPEFAIAINKADIALPDGVSILWAAKFLSLPPANFYMTIWQLIKSLAAILVNRRYIESVIHEQVSGSSFVWEIASLAWQKNFSLALVGGINRAADLAAARLRSKFPDLRINLVLGGADFSADTIKQIQDSNSDILLIAYSPPKQEIWLYNNIQKLGVKAAFGLGGTFDYLAGIYPRSPDFLRFMGLEWLWRLLTQPWRFKRIWRAVPLFILNIFQEKLRGGKTF